MTNAACNRDAAEKAFRGGLTIQQIAAEWPAVFRVVEEGGIPRLSQLYDYTLADGSGRNETNRRITSDSVNAAIAKRKHS